jgi:2-(1,2-epoxy-1,2-dihydrophenyl)acetyl-CoA isomerase
VNEAQTGSSILLRHDGAVAWTTLNRPERLNAFAGTMRDDLYDAINSASRHEGTRVIVITGAGRAFCAGADIDVMQELLAADDERSFSRLVEAGMRVVLAIRSAPQLVIAAVNGVAAGAGASLAAACDLRIASDEAEVGFTFNRIGLHPDWGASYSLPRLVGFGRAAELIYSGRMLGSEEAAAIGLWQYVLSAKAWEEELTARVGEFAAKPPLAITASKHTLQRTLSSDLQTMLDVEASAQVACFRSRDVREGLAAFRDRRKPRFRGEQEELQL